MSPRLIAAFVVALLALGVAAQEARTDERTVKVERRAGDDLFTAGGSVRIGRPVGGDVFAAGGNVDVDGAVGGDAVVAGGNVRIGAPVAQTLYAAGGQLVISAPIGHNARIAGGEVEFDRRAQVAGNVSVAGGQVTIEGRVNGYLRVAGGSVVIDGAIEGDVVSTAGSIELGPNARIGGSLRYASRDAIKQHPDAQVLGGITSLPFEARAPAGESSYAVGGGAGWVWTAGLLLVAVVLSAALPEASRRVTETLLRRPAMSLLLGFIALVCIPVAAILLLVTIIGIPLGLLVLLLYPPLLLIGYVGTGIGVGHLALRRYAPTRSTQTGWRIAAAAAGMLALALLGRLPWLGGLLVFAALLIGVGALALQFARRPQAT